MSKRRTTREEDFATVEFIAEALRPMVIARNRPPIEESEARLSSAMLGEGISSELRRQLARITGPKDGDGTANDPSTPSTEASPPITYALEDSQPIEPPGAPAAPPGEPLTGVNPVALLSSLADEAATDETDEPVPLRRALIERLCLFQEKHRATSDEMGLVALATYRLLAQRLLAIQAVRPQIDDLRAVPLTDLPEILEPRPWVFADHDLRRPFARSHVKESMSAIKALVRAPDQDRGWADATRTVEIARDDEEKVARLPAAERAAARDFLARDRIRSRFYRQVFLDYLSADECDIEAECKGEPTVLAWLLGMAETPHLYPFLQGQSEEQKRFRIARLAEKLVQLHEIYARVGQALTRDRVRERLADKSTRECLSYLVQVHYPMITPGADLTLAALLCPLRVFITFVQGKVQAGDFILPPDPKSRSAGG